MKHLNVFFYSDIHTTKYNFSFIGSKESVFYEKWFNEIYFLLQIMFLVFFVYVFLSLMHFHLWYWYSSTTLFLNQFFCHMSMTKRIMLTVIFRNDSIEMNSCDKFEYVPTGWKLANMEFPYIIAAEDVLLLSPFVQFSFRCCKISTLLTLRW